MTAYYNEIEPYAAQWLRNLMAEGLIPAGDVDERSIIDVRATDLVGYDQCHFFAGLGGWARALRLAGWPDDLPVWTGSCPCQPFSAAGKGLGKDDPRHLWPVWFRLIRECRPERVYGEQVAAAIAHGWLDLVFDDLEGEGYACGAAVLPACSVGAFHKRERLWFVADLHHERCDGEPVRLLQMEPRQAGAEITGCGPGVLADAKGTREEPAKQPGQRCCAKQSGNAGVLADAEGPRLRSRTGREYGQATGNYCGLGNTLNQRFPGRQGKPGDDGPQQPALERTGGDGPWDNPVWLPCSDGKTRPTQSGLLPLAYGLPRSVGPVQPRFRRLDLVAKIAEYLRQAKANRVGRLKAYGNAIVPQTAANFIKATED